MSLDASDTTLRSLLEELAAARGKLAGRASMAVVELAADRGDSTPLHLHEEPEALHVLAGSLTVFVGAETFRLDAGETFLAPARVAHAHRAEADGTTYLAASFVRSVSASNSRTRCSACSARRSASRHLIASAPIQHRLLWLPSDH